MSAIHPLSVCGIATGLVAWACGLAACCGSVLAAAESARPAPLHDGDRVLFLGDTFFEREAQRGFIETALAAAHPDAAVTFRNLGWSGDTVWAESRGVFDPPQKGYERMLGLVGELAPTVVFLAYGRNESERGESGLEAFRTQLSKLCDDVRAAAAGKEKSPDSVRLVLLTPTRFETTDADRRNASLAGYSHAIREVAAAKQAGLVDLYAQPAEAGRSTENGVHLTDGGYAMAATAIAREACGATLPPDFVARSAPLRGLVVGKNTLFFHRWRPANETYIFLFRKHEQGKNAAEMPQFDPLVAEAEGRIRKAVKETAGAP